MVVIETSYTLSELLSYADTLSLETYRWFSHPDYSALGFLMAIALIGGLVFLATRSDIKEKIGDYEHAFICIALVLLVGIPGNFHVASETFLPESQIKYEVERAKWERELVPAYLNSLPVREQLDIQDIAYNDGLTDNTLREATLLPLRVTLADKSVIELWAKVLPLQEGMTDSQLTYQILEEDLIFHKKEEVFQKKGYMNAVLYTNEKI